MRDDQTVELVGDHISVLSDWRQLSYTERGAQGGQSVFFFHDLPGSRMQQHPDRSIALNLGVRLIHPDRPGFGMSTLRVQRSFKDWASDIEQLADSLNIERFAIAAIGGGAPFALACALQLPERVSRVAIAATYAPPEMLRGMASWRLRAKLMLMRRVPSSLRALLKKDSYRARHNVYHYLRRWEAQLGPCDVALLDKETRLREQYEQDAREAFRQSTSGVRSDLSLLAYDWGIAFQDIRAELCFWHGSEDRIVPVTTARRFVESIPQAQLKEISGAGHLVWYGQWTAMLEFLRA